MIGIHCSNIWSVGGPAAPAIINEGCVLVVKVAGSRGDVIFILRLPTQPGACCTVGLCNRMHGQHCCTTAKHVELVVAADGHCGADLRANCQGTGFVVTDEGGHTILIDFSEPVGGPVASLHND